MIGVADTCFILDWASYTRKDCIKSVFNRILITEEEERINEIVSENAINMTAEWLGDGFMYLVPTSRQEEIEVDHITRKIIEIPQVPTEVEKPELLCLVLAKKYNCVLLTENIGAIRITQWMEKYKEVKVWRALEVIKEAIKKKILTGKTIDIFKEYQIQTKDTFPKNDIKKCIMELE